MPTMLLLLPAVRQERSRVSTVNERLQQMQCRATGSEIPRSMNVLIRGEKRCRPQSDVFMRPPIQNTYIVLTKDGLGEYHKGTTEKRVIT